MHSSRHYGTAAGHGSSLFGKGWCGPWCPCHGVLCATFRRHVSQCRSLAVRSVGHRLIGDCSWTWAAVGQSMQL